MSTARRSVLVLLGLAVTATGSARADGWWFTNGDDCAPGTRPRQAKPEYLCEFRQTKVLGKLDCAGLAFFAESQRHAMNQQTLGSYLRPVGSFGVSAPAPAATPATAPAATPAPATTPATAPAPASPTSAEALPTPTPTAPAEPAPK